MGQLEYRSTSCWAIRVSAKPSAVINYVPPPTVREMIRHYTPHELFFDWIIGAVGSGKTTGIFFKLVYMASLQAPSPVDGIRRTRAVIVRNTAPQLNDTTLSSWNYWFKDGQAGTWRATDKKFTLRFADVECEVLFRPLDTPDDVARVLSLEVTFAILDEFVQIDQRIVEALSARVGRYPPKIDGGATNWGMWGASNPGDEDVWWYDYLHEQLPSNVTLYTQPSGFSPEAENLPNLPGGADYYHNLAKGKPDQWIKQFIEGEWGYTLNGKPVVPTFTPAIHIAKEPLEPNPHLPLVVGFDPGLGGSALIFGQMDLNGRLIVLDELVQQDYGAERLCSDRLKPLLKSRFQGFEVIISPDPAANFRAQSNERTVVDTLKEAKNRAFWAVKFPPGSEANNTLSLRLTAVESFTTRLTVGGPALIIDPRCKNLIRALNGGWRYVVTKGRRSPEPEKNQYSHPGDAFGYLCRYFHASEARAARHKDRAFMPPTFRNSYAVR